MLSLIFSVLAGGFDAPVSLSNCELADMNIPSRRWIMYCDITNSHPDIAVSALRYTVSVRDQNRQVSWAESDKHFPESISISGGVEPMETVRTAIVFPAAPANASRDTMIVEFTKLEAIGPDGKPLTRP